MAEVTKIHTLKGDGKRNAAPGTIFGALRRLRACNKTQLAKALGISRKTLHQWEADPEAISQNGRQRLADLLAVTLRAAHADLYQPTPSEPRNETHTVLAHRLSGIGEPPGSPLGLTFWTEAQATAYAERLRDHGYAVEQLPPEEPLTSADDALTIAADHFGDGRLTAGRQ